MTDGHPGDPMRVTLVMLTFHRPDDLRTVVPMLLERARAAEADADHPLRVRILIVDNDPGRSGYPAVQPHEGERLRYVVEETPGIAAARNRALDELEGEDLLLFIDDDERPRAGWPLGMIDVHRRTGATAVAGPVISEFIGDLDPWVAAGDFFYRRRRPSGTKLEVAATGNLLLDLRQLRRLGVRFEPAVGLYGAEDTLFTRTLVKRGALIVWCDEAELTDLVPAERMTPRWAITRSFSHGNSSSMVALALESGPGGRARVAFDGLVRFVGGGCRFALGVVVRSARHQARGLRTCARGAGMLVGSMGLAFQEYGTVTSRRRRLRRAPRLSVDRPDHAADGRA
jgi:hypothetical protein